MASECEQKSGKVATPCCTHPITSLGEDVFHIVAVYIGIHFSKLFDFCVMEWQKWRRKADQEILSCC